MADNQESEINSFIQKNSIILSIVLVLVINISQIVTFSFKRNMMVNSVCVLLILIIVILTLLFKKLFPEINDFDKVIRAINSIFRAPSATPDADAPRALTPPGADPVIATRIVLVNGTRILNLIKKFGIKFLLIMGSLAIIGFPIYVLTIMNKRPTIDPPPKSANPSSIQKKPTAPMVGQSFSFGQQLINIIFTIIIFYLFLFVGGNIIFKLAINEFNFPEDKVNIYIRLLILCAIGYFVYLLIITKNQNSKLTKKYNKSPE